MALPLILYRENDNLVTLPNVVDRSTGQLVVDAIITATLYDMSDREADPNFSGVPMDAMTTKPGSYQGLISNAFKPPKGLYYILYTGDSNGRILHVRQKAEVRDREVK